MGNENENENVNENVNENENENVNVNEEVQKGLKTDIREYIDLDDEIKKINSTLKELKLEKKKMEENILQYMKKTNTDQINLGKGKLKLVKGKSYEGLKKEYIISQLTEGKMDKSKAEDIADSLMKNRKMNEVTKIQRN
jgi:hypothetical protein